MIWNIEGCDDKLKSYLFDVVSQHGEMFQEPNGLPPKRGIQHEIQLQQDVPLPNIGMYHISIMESLEIKNKIQEFLNKGIICPCTFPWFTNYFGTKEGWDLAHVHRFSCTK